MNKSGFAFIEIIITVVVLCTSLLLIYSTYSAILSDENTRLYYDDPAFIYKTNYVKKYLEEYSEIETLKETSFTNNYILGLGTGLETIFNSEDSEEKKQNLELIINGFRINQMFLVKSELFDECLQDTEECKKSISNLNYDMQKYINTLSDTSYDYYLVIEYAIKENNDENSVSTSCTIGIDKRCKIYYTSLGI